MLFFCSEIRKQRFRFEKVHINDEAYSIRRFVCCQGLMLKDEARIHATQYTLD